jgi:hypothetical protein
MCASHVGPAWKVRGLFQKLQRLNQTSFYPSHNSFTTTIFPKVAAYNDFSQSHSPTKYTLTFYMFHQAFWTRH